MFTDEEIWQPVASSQGEFASLYEVSSHGHIRRVGATGYLIPTIDSNGYPIITLRNEEKSKRFRIHVLVMEAFRGQRPDGRIVRHLNGIRYESHLANLAWGTHTENAADAAKHAGRSVSPVARSHGRSIGRLSAEQVLEIRLLRKGGSPLAALAERFGVSQSTIAETSFGKRYALIHADAIVPQRGLRRGVDHPKAKLTEDLVTQMRRDRVAGASYAALAEKYDVDPESAKRTCIGRYWRHVPMPATA